MDTKALLIGIGSFLAGGLLVSVAATTFDKPQNDSHAMSSMVSSLEGKQGDAYDQAFLEQMIIHHQGAVDMARMSRDQAKHPEIKQLSEEIIKAQEKEIAEMKHWQHEWGYRSSAGMDRH